MSRYANQFRLASAFSSALASGMIISTNLERGSPWLALDFVDGLHTCGLECRSAVAGFGVLAGDTRSRYWRSAACTTSDRLRCVAAQNRSRSDAVAGGREIATETRVRVIPGITRGVYPRQQNVPVEAGTGVPSWLKQGFLHTFL